MASCRAGRWLSWNVVLVAVSGCVAVGSQRPPLPLDPPGALTIPEAWANVRLAEVTGEQGPAELAVPAVQALGETLVTRLGTQGEGRVVLRVINVHTAKSDSPLGNVTAGLGADFVLTGPEGERTIRLEHSLTFFATNEDSLARAYRRLIDDLLDQLFYHEQALAFLGGAAVAGVKDAGLGQGLELGPVIELAPSEAGMRTTGRILWGERETSNGGVGTLIVQPKDDNGSSSTGVIAGFSNRSANTKTGLGWRSNFGLGGLVARQEGTTTATNFFLFQYMLGVELGILRTNYDPEGYVDYPGLSLSLVPQASGMQGLASVEGMSINMVNLLVGGAAELDLPLGSTFGFLGSYFVGKGFNAITVSGEGFSGTFRSEMTVKYPAFDLYIQRPDGRVSLGLTLKQLSTAAQETDDQADQPKTYNFTFTYQDRVGRGLAFAKSDLAVAGSSLSSRSTVLATPPSAFPPGAPRVVVAAARWAPPGAPPPSPSVSPAPATPGTLPVILKVPTADVLPPSPPVIVKVATSEVPPKVPASPPRLVYTFVHPELRAAMSDLVREAVREELARAGVSALDDQRVRDFLKSVGVDTLGSTDLVDAAVGLGAERGVWLSLTPTATGVVVEVSAVRASAVVFTAKDEVSRLQSIRVLRQHLRSALQD